MTDPIKNQRVKKDPIPTTTSQANAWTITL